MINYSAICEDCGERVDVCDKGCNVEETYADDGISLPKDYHINHRYCPFSKRR